MAVGGLVLVWQAVKLMALSVETGVRLFEKVQNGGTCNKLGICFQVGIEVQAKAGGGHVPRHDQQSHRAGSDFGVLASGNQLGGPDSHLGPPQIHGPPPYWQSTQQCVCYSPVLSSDDVCRLSCKMHLYKQNSLIGLSHPCGQIFVFLDNILYILSI